MKPVIGITTFSERKPHKIYATVSRNYIRSVDMAGGVPVLLPVMEDCSLVSSYLRAVDGLLLSGGEDVSPLLYGEHPVKEVEYFDPDRDAFEIELFKRALDMDMPVLGVCRGIQVMNIAMGGSIYQDLFSQAENALGHFPKQLPVDNLYHRVKIRETSRLHKIFGTCELDVNSFHHQSVKEAAKEFEVTAFSSDNIVEAMEHRSKDFVIAVQWHPEDLTIKHPVFRKLFEALVNKSKK